MTERPEPLSLTVDWQGDKHVFPKGSTVLVGRDADCDVIIADTRVSRHHLELVGDATGWLLRDHSSNGTWSEGVRSIEGPIPDRMTLHLGHPEDGPRIALSVAAPETPGPPEAGSAAEPVTPTADAAELSELELTGQITGEPELPLDPIRLRDGLTLGRDSGNDVVIMDLLASRNHARIHRSPGGRYTVDDLGATNLTFVNGEPVRGATAARDGRGETALHDGDILTIGRTRLLRVGDRLYPLPPILESGLDITDLCYELPDGRRLATGLTFAVRGPQLLAVIGPSGAGKSTLLQLLSGRLRPSGGEIRYHDGDVTDHAETRSMIGLVPQHMVAHGRLRVGDALEYVAQLRLPTDMPRDERAARVADVLTELGLAEHTETRVDRLSGGQQRRLAIGFELLTRPSLLLVDEPTAGLDPALARHVMRLLRALADGSRQVVVTTHDLAHLELFDQVLVLAPGGRKVFLGRPADLAKRFGTTQWPDIFERLAGEALPDEAVRPLRNRRSSPRRLPGSDLTSSSVRRRILAQAWVVARRQLRLMAADPAYVAFNSALPVVLALLALTVPGGQGLGAGADPAGSTEAARILVVLLVGAAFMGMAPAARDLVAERVIYRHERATGLLPESYLLAKFTVFGSVAVLQSAVLVGLVRLDRAGPSSAVLLGSPTLELAVAVAATATACVMLGLEASARVATTEQSTIPLVVAVMTQFVLCGGIFPISGRAVLQQLSWLTPARWGYAAAASTTGLHSAEHDPLWAHSPLSLLGAYLALAVLTCAFALHAQRPLREL